jgi:3-oxoacyl-[acyl-carrier-protein] synthase-3
MRGKIPSHPPGHYAHIVGWGMDVPARILTNDDLTQMVDTSDAWVRERTGIAERRIAADGDSVITLGLRAARQALSSADMLPDELDLIIVATSSPVYLFPATACVIQDRLGAEHAGAFDVMAACSGFIYALGIAAAQIRVGGISTALVIGAETLSRIVDWSDRETCILFGDGAGAFVLRESDMPGGVLEVVMHSDGSGGNLLYAPSGIRPRWDAPEMVPVNTRMNGREVFRFATRVMASATREAVGRAGLRLEEIDWVVPHQANLRIIQSAMHKLELPEDRVIINIDRYGNTSTASIPIAVVEAVEAGQIGPDNRLVLVGFGGGLTWGAAVIEWAVTPTRAPRIRDLMREARYILATVRSFLRRLWRFLEALILNGR